MKKKCTKCKEEKNLSEFRKDKNRVDKHQSWCKLCARSQSRKYKDKSVIRTNKILKEHRILYTELKDTLSCERCGEDENCCIEFHHKNPDNKNFTISSNLIRNWRTILAEIDKCMILCSNCHKKVHKYGLDFNMRT